MSHASAMITDNIEAYLRVHERKGLLRFITCGSVDDGKSTLIGRLLHDARMIFEDQLAAVARDSKRCGTTGERMDLALLVDGLQAEREQGITIDVAYRFFSTDKRKFIIADTPGHEQYTRNMVTGASTADLAVILIDARLGVQAQTRRHSFLCDLLGIRHLVVAVNKMDLVGYSRERFEEIVEAYRHFATRLAATDIRFVPLSALEGDNVVDPSERMPWYQLGGQRGPALLPLLEQIDITTPAPFEALRFPVQYVNRPNPHFRGYCGTLAAGALRPGDAVRVLPSRRRARVARLVTTDGDLEIAYPGQSITVTLDAEVDVSRGDMLVAEASELTPCSAFSADLVWLHETPLALGHEYELKAATRSVCARVVRLQHQVDVDTLAHMPTQQLVLNGIARCQIEVDQPLVLDSYQRSPGTGAFVLIDRFNHLTVAAGMVVDTLSAANLVWHDMAVTQHRRAERHRQKPCVVWFTGLSGAGKSSVADALERQLFGMGHSTYLLDGDNLRHGLCSDLGFGDHERQENMRRVGEVARLMVDAGMIVLVALISPFRQERQRVRERMAPGEFIEVFVNTPLEVCERRDPKGLYRRARAGEIAQFTGISSPYEAPQHPELEIDTSHDDLALTVAGLIAELRREGVI
ncbi:sulfate adenylyltransferase subunit CysN [Salinicola endophyticus]|uniref:Multifunctional fusion protein n=1 Tax=Salinicola endophyticus TaxID=1949083 RepID=A0ABY8FS16_9GAMM|nr:sulfate adenylyltransferase subunit CysN [Salinicola endophyticus]WFF42669.1 sulfate adenylyltransferase subunit CysN [Salinicola endophyticus]